MKILSKPFTDEKNQVIFLTFGLFWVSNIGALIGNTHFNRLFIYPIYLIFHLIFIYLLFSISKNNKNIDNAAYCMLWFLAVLGVVCAARGIFYDKTTDDIRSLLFSGTGSTIVWLMPVALIYGLKKEFWFNWLPRLKVIVVIGLVYVFLVMLLGIYSKDITAHKVYNSADFLFISSFLFVFSIYQSNKINIFIGCIGVFLLTAHMFLHDERFAIAYIGLMSIFYFSSIIIEHYRLDLKVYIISIGSLLLLVSILVAYNVPVFHTYIIKYFIHGEMWADTRGSGSLSEAVTHGMSTLELAFGRGLFGKYTWGYRGWPPVLYVRGGVEIGFMQIILKGGYIMLASFLLLSTYAIYLGLFRSKNKITRYLTVIIIARLIIMFAAMYPRVGFEYFMYWLAVGGCLSPQLRALDDSTIKKKCETRPLVIRW